MATGLRRETMGDIYIDDDGKTAYLAVLQTVVPFLCDTLTGVGRDKVRVRPLAAENLPEKAERFADLSVTLASLRLDALLSGALNLSREQQRNWFPPDASVSIMPNARRSTARLPKAILCR